jgi:hypothetical protein
VSGWLLVELGSLQFFLSWHGGSSGWSVKGTTLSWLYEMVAQGRVIAFSSFRGDDLCDELKDEVARMLT